MRAARMMVLALVLAACGDAGPVHPLGPASLQIENKSQYLLRELRRHPTPSYQDAPSIGPLERDAVLQVHGSGRWYLTVIRERYAGGPQVALTTGSPLSLADGEGYRLEVLDQSFRISDAPWAP